MQIIESSALQLLAEQGVLSGLNLREVADRASVNRGLVYHYFGSRRALLRSSLRRTFHQVARVVAMPEPPPPPGPLAAGLFRDSLDFHSRWRTIALLLLDDDSDVKILPMIDNSQRIFNEAKAAGLIASDADAQDFIALLWSIIYGYAMLRPAFTRELGLPPEAIDGRLETLLGRLFSALDGPALDGSATATLE